MTHRFGLHLFPTYSTSLPHLPTPTGEKTYILRQWLPANDLSQLGKKLQTTSKTKKHVKGRPMSRLCNPCGLCDCHGKHNKSMIPCVLQIMTKTKSFPLKQNLTRPNYGIYMATCVICHEQYVGQISNKFSVRWSSPRSNWNKQDYKTDNYQMIRHHSNSHGTINKIPLYEVCTGPD